MAMKNYKYLLWGRTDEKRPPLGFDRLSEKVGPRGKKFPRDHLLLSVLINGLSSGTDRDRARTLERLVRLYNKHLINKVASYDTAAQTVLDENFLPRRVNAALVLLGIARPNTAVEFAPGIFDGPEILLDYRIVDEALRRRKPTGSLEGYEEYCTPRPQRVMGRDQHD
jgi:hypothetical protein